MSAFIAPRHGTMLRATSLALDVARSADQSTLDGQTMAKKTPEQRAEIAEEKLRKSVEQFNHIQEKHVLLRKEAQKLLANFLQLRAEHSAQRAWIEALTKVINESPKDPDRNVTHLHDDDLEGLGLAGKRDNAQVISGDQEDNVQVIACQAEEKDRE